MYTRETQIINIAVQLPNTVQPVNGMPVVMTAVDTIKLEGKQVGHPQQRQQHVIPSDVKPEWITALNNQLETIGYKLVEIEE